MNKTGVEKESPTEGGIHFLRELNAFMQFNLSDVILVLSEDVFSQRMVVAGRDTLPVIRQDRDYFGWVTFT